MIHRVGVRADLEKARVLAASGCREVQLLDRNGKPLVTKQTGPAGTVVKRVLEMERVEGKVVATGGVVAHHPMVVELLEEAIGAEVIVPEHAQEMGALGAALAARAAAVESAPVERAS